MRLHHALLIVSSIFLAPAAQASEVSWMFRPGYYTHSPETGKRVAQYEPDRPSYVSVDPTYQESGYRHELIQAGNEWLNVVQTWGAGTAIRPYGEWEYPYRAGATPYGPWGNPQGPWTLPFDSWRNPFAYNRGQYNGNGGPGYGGGSPINNGGWGQGSQQQPWSAGAGPQGYPGAGNMPPPSAAMPQGQGL